MSRRPTSLAAVAALAGVSRQTVGFILGGKDHLFRPDTCAKVRQAAQDLAYRPHAAAHAFRTGTTGCVALLYDHNPFRSAFHSHLVLPIEVALAASDRYLVMGGITPAGGLPAVVTKVVSDGLIISYHGEIPPALVEALDHQAAPAVHVNTKRSHDAVYPDDLGGSQAMTAWLATRGHRRIAYADMALDPEQEAHYSRRDRREGYLAAMRVAGLAPRLLERPHGPQAPTWEDFLHRALAGADCPTAFVFYGKEGLVALRFAALRRKLRIPEDVIGCTFVDYYRPDFGFPAPVMIVPWGEIGPAAVAMLDRRIASEGPEAARGLPLHLAP